MESRCLGNGHESPVRPGRPSRPSKPCPSRQRHRVDLSGPQTRAGVPGLLVETVGHPTRTGVARDRWSTPGTLGPSASSLGQLFSTAAPSTVQSGSGCWLKPWSLRHGPESPECLVDHADPRTRSRVSRERGRHRAHSDTGPIHPGQLINPAGARTKARVAVIAGRPRGPSETSASPPGQLVDPAGPRTGTRVTRDSWSTPSVFGPGPQSPGTAGRPRRLLDASTCGPREQVHPAGPLSRSGVPWDSFMTPWALGSGPESPGTAGQPRLPADQAQVAWERYSTLWHLRHGSESPEMLLATVGPREWA